MRTPTRCKDTVIQEQKLTAEPSVEAPIDPKVGPAAAGAKDTEVAEKVGGSARQDVQSRLTTEDSATATATAATAEADGDGADKPVVDVVAAKRRLGVNVAWSRVAIFGILPGIALLLVLAAAWLKWEDASMLMPDPAGREAVQAATDGAVAILTYQPNTVDKDLGAAQSRLTGTFKDAYFKLTHDVVIPGAKQQQISAVATVPAAALVSTRSSTHAVVLLAVNQTTVVGKDAPSQTASTVRVTLDKVDGRWLISGFDPV